MVAGRKNYLDGWRLYPFSMVGHHVQGAIAGAVVLAASTQLVVTAVLWTVLYVCYQGLSVLRKDDSPGLDIADYMVGFGVGVVAIVTFRLVSGGML